MKLLRLGSAGSEIPAAIAPDGLARDLSTWVSNWEGKNLEPEFLLEMNTRLKAEYSNLPAIDQASMRIGPPIVPGLMLCVGGNYTNHTLQVGLNEMQEPIIAAKAASALCGPYDNLILPPNTSKVDWEVELGVVIGKRAQYLNTAEDSRTHIAGFSIANDLSDREWLLERCGEWIKGKSFETFAPVGPYLVTSDEFVPQNTTRLTCRVDDQIMQDGTISEMRFNVFELVHYISQFMILNPGDFILSGSPAGSALGRDNPSYLKPGSVLESKIDGLGMQRQLCTRLPEN